MHYNLRIKLTSISKYVEPILFQSLCILYDIGDASSVGYANDTFVKLWFFAYVSETPRDILYLISSDFKIIQICSMSGISV